jgi:small subunit ribosomal protein S13
MGKQRIRDLERKERKKEQGDVKEVKKPVVSEKRVDRVQIIRLAETNLNGNRMVVDSIRGVRGVGFVFANAVTKVTGFGNKRLGELSEDELKHLETVIINPSKFAIPAWVYNRKRDPVSGENTHHIASQLEFATKIDINEMKKLKTYKGMRHAAGLPVRGQRTRSSFRKSGKAVGVRRKKQAPAKRKKV